MDEHIVSKTHRKDAKLVGIDQNMHKNVMSLWSPMTRENMLGLGISLKTRRFCEVNLNGSDMVIQGESSIYR